MFQKSEKHHCSLVWTFIPRLLYHAATLSTTASPLESVSFLSEMDNSFMSISCLSSFCFQPNGWKKCWRHLKYSKKESYRENSQSDRICRLAIWAAKSNYYAIRITKQRPLMSKYSNLSHKWPLIFF